MTKVIFLEELQLQCSKRIIIINGYILPPFGVIILITNMLVIIVYLKQWKRNQSEIHKVSSILYITIATSNILSSVPVSIVYFYLFTLGHVTKYIPYHLCWTWHFLLQYIYIPHMTSIWAVTILSVQRCMVIRYPFSSPIQWTVRKTLIFVVCLWIIPLLLQISSIFDTTISPYEIYRNATTRNRTINETDMITCTLHYAEWKGDNPETLDAVEFAFKLVAYILIPFVLIVYSDFSLMLYLRNARQVRKRILEEAININERNILEKRPNQRNSITSQTENSDSRYQTLLVVIFSSIVFIVHIPYAILLVLYIYVIVTQNYYYIKWFNIGPIKYIIDFTVHLSHPNLFILSCLLSKRFRRLMKKLFKSSQKPENLKRRRSSSERTVFPEM